LPTASSTGTADTRPSQKWRRIALILAGVTALLLVAGLVAFCFPRQCLCVDSGEVKADAIVLLGGGAGERPTRAAELFRAGVANTILVSGAGDTDDNRRLLVKRGVPAGAIRMERESRTTRENALLSIRLLRSLGAKRVVIVTSWYHSRRALKCFEHYAPDMEFYSRPSYFAYEQSEWSRERTGRRIRIEYLKIIGYWFRYGIAPL
jgi:uncharacterized SAM-binding protein YcdF (DUF218 family)